MAPRSKLIHDAAKAAPAELYHLNGERTLIDAVDAHTAELRITNEYLATISEVAGTTLTFFKKWIWIAVAVASVAYPSVGKIVDKVSMIAAQ